MYSGCLQVAVADCDPAVRRALQIVMQKDEQLRFVGGAGDGAEAYRLIRERQPDVAIIDMVMPKVDGFTLIEQIKRDRTIRKTPQFILTTSAHSEQIMNAAFRMGVSYFILKPYDPQIMTDRVKQLSGLEDGSGVSDVIPSGTSLCEPSGPELEIAVRDMLHELGIPAHLRGYRYMVTAVCTAVEDERMLECVTKELYPYVAKEHASTPSRVERALRHAIEVAWSRGSVEAQDKLFGNTVSALRGRPTNSEFIAMVAAHIRSK